MLFQCTLSYCFTRFILHLQVTHMVHLLPHERYDLYKKTVSKICDMEECLSDLGNCKNNDGSTCQERIKIPKVKHDNGDPMLSKNESEKEENLAVLKQANENSHQNDDNQSNENIFKSQKIAKLQKRNSTKTKVQKKL